MNAKEIEQYKKEMMKLYGKRIPSGLSETPAEETAEEIPEENIIETIPETEEVDEEIPEENHSGIIEEESEIPEENELEETVSPEVNEILERFPEPDLSDISEEEYPVPEYESESSMGDSTGYILVNVRAGHEAYPIENASVLVTAIVDGNRFIVASGLTDISGSTLKLQTPAPAFIYSQVPNPAKRPYSLFDVSVMANGYFNARSVDVPVFSGITSIQNFNMIPVPLAMHSDDETLIYFNQEPKYN